jgi:hypothetical protein
MGSRYDHITIEERHLICRWRDAKVCSMIGPREIHDPTEGHDRSVWSYVFLFEG